MDEESGQGGKPQLTESYGNSTAGTPPVKAR